jgi:Cell Wall Hydrolase
LFARHSNAAEGWRDLLAASPSGAIRVASLPFSFSRPLGTILFVEGDVVDSVVHIYSALAAVVRKWEAGGGSSPASSTSKSTAASPAAEPAPASPIANAIPALRVTQPAAASPALEPLLASPPNAMPASPMTQSVAALPAAEPARRSAVAEAPPASPIVKPVAAATTTQSAPFASIVKPVAALPIVDPNIKPPPSAWRSDLAPSVHEVPENEESPAERLGLTGKLRARAEKCLADAVYYEARGESLRGQIAVAQVVMNRVFSGRYPRNVCGVVYQNATHYLACQFTFACEGRSLGHISEPKMWRQAKRVATETLDGKIWLSEVGHATHYHASWVRPYWVRQMAKLYRLGVHIFYRPRAWGDGSNAPSWGEVAVTPKVDGGAEARQPEAAAKHPRAAAAP